MTLTNQQIMKNTITTAGITAGLLNPEQAMKFIQQTFEATPLGGMVRSVVRRAKTGEVDKIGIGSRVIRKKTENTDDGYRAKPTFGKIEYATVAVRLPWEITEESLRENIEGQNFEEIVTNLMTRQLGVDLEDLRLNGDTATLDTDPDYDFLKINDGWLKQLNNGSHVEDRTAKEAGATTLAMFYDALKQLPDKYNDGTLRWMMSPSRKQTWELYLYNQAISNGGGLNESLMRAPAGIPIVEVPRMPSSKIVLSNPKNLIVVNTYDVRIRKTTEGQEAIMQDKRFYVVHLDDDPIIEELDACVLVKGLM
ncbi:phage major capsid protein [Desulforamulus aquiferis]|uniref:Phage major capsid protein n=1 Tax=Desulforamulus aquiferis TaxID=1397668 RepID=A0AAW7ZBQ4_9FIRM|nr:phage major capsid protein [Desulforamulus aquiferis]MDO7787133.1 phage major capsid protein [Desulforamulus aquiferis]